MLVIEIEARVAGEAFPSGVCFRTVLGGRLYFLAKICGRGQPVPSNAREAVASSSIVAKAKRIDRVAYSCNEVETVYALLADRLKVVGTTSWLFGDINAVAVVENVSRVAAEAIAASVLCGPAEGVIGLAGSSE